MKNSELENSFEDAQYVYIRPRSPQLNGKVEGSHRRTKRILISY